MTRRHLIQNFLWTQSRELAARIIDVGAHKSEHKEQFSDCPTE